MRLAGPLPTLTAVGLTALLLVAGCGGAKAPANGSGPNAGKQSCSVGAASLQGAPAGATTLGSSATPVQLIHDQPLAEVFTASASFSSVGVQSPTWFTQGSGYTLTLHQGPGLKGKVVVCSVFTDAVDNQWNALDLSTAAAAGVYTLEMSDPTGTATAACPGHESAPNCSTTPLSGKKGGVIGWWAAAAGADSDNYALVAGKQNGDLFTLFYQ